MKLCQFYHSADARQADLNRRMPVDARLGILIDGKIVDITDRAARHHNLLDPQYETWDDLLLDAVDDVIEQASAEGALADRRWSEYNVTEYRHPLSPALPFLARFLDMPAHALPGDLYTPNMHWGAQAPSERMIVSPGREAEGILHMPTGQSGHPLSPNYGDGHAAWAEGRPTPFLPGPAAHTLVLRP